LTLAPGGQIASHWLFGPGLVPAGQQRFLLVLSCAFGQQNPVSGIGVVLAGHCSVVGRHCPSMIDDPGGQQPPPGNGIVPSGQPLPGGRHCPVSGLMVEPAGQQPPVKGFGNGASGGQHGASGLYGFGTENGGHSRGGLHSRVTGSTVEPGAQHRPVNGLIGDPGRQQAPVNGLNTALFGQQPSHGGGFWNVPGGQRSRGGSHLPVTGSIFEPSGQHSPVKRFRTVLAGQQRPLTGFHRSGGHAGGPQLPSG
jgi:hypothetical protein